MRCDRSAVPAVLFLATLLAACGDGSPSGPAAPELALDRASAAPDQAVVAVVRGGSLPHGPLAVSVGGVAAAAAVRMDDTTFAVVVPAVGTGAHDLVVELGAGSAGARLTVLAPVSVANPAQYINLALEQATLYLDSLAAAYADPSLRPAGLDVAAFEADMAALRERFDAAQGQLATASEAERQRFAGFLAANADVFGVMAGAQGLTAGLGAAGAGSGACRSVSGALLNTYEACSAELDAFGYQARKRLVVLAALTAVAYAEGATGIGLLLAGATALVIYHELGKIQDGVWDRFFDPVVARLLESLPAQAAAGSAAASTSSFESGRRRAFAVQAEYRSLSHADAGLPGVSSLIGLATGIEQLINGIRTLLFLEPMKPLVPASPARIVAGTVPPQYLSVIEISPSGITGAGADSAGVWMLTFTRPGLTAPLPFNFQARYSPPRGGVQTRTVAAQLTPAPMTFSAPVHFTESSFVTTPGGPTCSWTGTVDGTLSIETFFVDGQSRVRATISATRTFPAGTRNPPESGSCSAGTYSYSGTLTGTLSGSSFQLSGGWNSVSGTIAANGESVTGTFGLSYDFTNAVGHYVGGGQTAFTATRPAGAVAGAPAPADSGPVLLPRIDADGRRTDFPPAREF